MFRKAINVVLIIYVDLIIHMVYYICIKRKQKGENKMDTIKKINYKNKTIKIVYDEFSDFSILDNLPHKSKVCLKSKNYDFKNNTDVDFDDYNSWEEIEKALEIEYKNYDIISICMYDHSLVSFHLNTTCQWDSGQIGFILIPKNHNEQWFNMDNFLDYWTAYFNGHVYEWLVYDICPCCENDEYYTEENYGGQCGGYLDEDEAVKEAKRYIDSLEEKAA